MCRGWGLVDLNVVCEGEVGVGAAFLSSLETRFSSSFPGDCLGLGDVEGCDFVAAPIKDTVNSPR
jgi:hypothetical protein